MFSLPLDGSRRLGGDVINHAVDATDFIHDAVGDLFQYVVGKRDPVGGHAVLRMHRADGAGVSISSLVAHHTHRHHWQQHSKRLPDLCVKTGATDFIHHDVVSFL